MNILVFSWRGPKHPNAGGAEISTDEHIRGWVQAGHSVTLFTSAFAGCKLQEEIKGIKIIRRGKQILGVQWEAFKWYLFESHPKFDLVVDQFHGIPFFTPLYTRTKKLAFIHEVTKEVWQLNPWSWPLNKIVGLTGKIFEPLLFKLIYKNIPFMTVSESTKNDLIKWNIPQERITVIHNGIRIPQFAKLLPKEKTKTVIYLGAISKDKGIEDALEAFSELTKMDNWQLWVVGKSDPKYLQKLKRLTSKLKIAKQVKFWGYVSEKAKYRLLAEAHLVINPSIREGWGLVVLEAAAVGTPTVGYNVPGLRDSILDGKTGLLCDSTPKACAQAVSGLMKDQKKYQMLRRNCVKWANRFKWEKACQQSLALIRQLMVAD